MAVIDPTTPVGKVRLRIGDFQDIPFLPDTVIQATLDEFSGNVPRAASQCAQYILAMLTSRTHRKLAQLETWSGEHFKNYVEFIKTTILNPHLMTLTPVPYTGMADEVHPLIQFIEDWNEGYCDSLSDNAAA